MTTILDAPRGSDYASVDGTFYRTRQDGTIEAYSWHLPALYARGYADHVPTVAYVPPPPIDAVEPDGPPSEPVRPDSPEDPAG